MKLYPMCWQEIMYHPKAPIGNYSLQSLLEISVYKIWFLKGIRLSASIPWWTLTPICPQDFATDLPNRILFTQTATENKLTNQDYSYSVEQLNVREYLIGFIFSQLSSWLETIQANSMGIHVSLCYTLVDQF